MWNNSGVIGAWSLREGGQGRCLGRSLLIGVLRAIDECCEGADGGLMPDRWVAGDELLDGDFRAASSAREGATGQSWTL